MKVGTRELKNRLSHYLKIVREGEPVYVTDHGTVVAELRPVARTRGKKKSDRQILLEMAARGEISLGQGKFADFRPVKLKRGKPVSRMILEDRR